MSLAEKRAADKRAAAIALVAHSRWYHPTLTPTDAHEGYRDGRFGVRLAMDMEIEAWYHEVAHALELVQRGEGYRLRYFGYDLGYPELWIGNQRCLEPTTTQAIERECRVLAIQAHLMAMDGRSDGMDCVLNFCKSLRFCIDFLLIDIDDNIPYAESDDHRIRWCQQLMRQYWQALTPEAVSALYARYLGVRSRLNRMGFFDLFDEKNRVARIAQRKRAARQRGICA